MSKNQKYILENLEEFLLIGHLGNSELVVQPARCICYIWPVFYIKK